jgi:hypothetical protein
MRLSVALGCLLLVGCAGPHSTGALWAQQNLEQETAMYRLSDAQRADRAHAFELGLVDDVLAAERARVESSLPACPGSDRQPLAVSAGDRLRDSVRVRAKDDPGRLVTLAQVALADWRVRRGRATGDATFCNAAQQALEGSGVRGQGSGVSPGVETDFLAGLGNATVTRDSRHGRVADVAWPASVALSNYALGYVDTVNAMAPLPQYLAAVYGGELLGAAAAPALNGATPESLVDRVAPDYPDWEPDALYAALTAGRT